jgi:hypothetical protein
MRKFLIILFLIASAVKIYDSQYNIKGYIENGKIYDNRWNVKGYIENDKVYDEKYNLQYRLEKENKNGNTNREPNKR